MEFSRSPTTRPPSHPRVGRQEGAFTQRPWHLCALLMGVMGCGHMASMDRPLNLHRERLGDDVPTLIAQSDRAHARSRGIRVAAISLAGLEKANRLQPNQPDVLWRMSRGFVTLAQRVPDRDLRRRFAQEAHRSAVSCSKAAPTRPECPYYEAAAAGVVATLTPTPTPDLQRNIESPAERLREIDEDYEQGGGLRILGALYARAPAWPAGVGDLEEAVALLEAAVQRHPAHPLNHFFLAEAYARSGRLQDAINAYKTVLRAPPAGEWGLIGRSYRKQALARVRALRRMR